MTRHEIVSKVEGAWSELKRVLDRVPDDEIEVPGVVGAWSVRDLMGHVATWDAEAHRTLRQFLIDGDASSLVAWADVDEFNARESERKSATSVAEIYRSLAQTHLELVELLSGLDEADFARNEVETRIRIDTYDHYPDHGDQIARWLEGRGLIPSPG